LIFTDNHTHYSQSLVEKGHLLSVPTGLYRRVSNRRWSRRRWKWRRLNN